MHNAKNQILVTRYPDILAIIANPITLGVMMDTTHDWLGLCGSEVPLRYTVFFSSTLVSLQSLKLLSAKKRFCGV